MRTYSRGDRGNGFTLIELMVTIAVAAILLVVAVPGFLSFQRSSAVMSASSSFAAALNIARAEAIKRGIPTLVQPSPAGSTDWSAGWIVCVDMDYSGSCDTTKGDVSLLQQSALPKDVSVPLSVAAPAFKDSKGAFYVRYDGYGNPSAVSAATMTWPNMIDFSAKAGSQVTTRRVILNLVGRARTCDPIQNSTTCQ